MSLHKKFLTIKKQGWIKSMREGATGVGYTFETLLGKQEDYFPIPDYEGIEIKTMRYFSKMEIFYFQ